MDRFERIRIFNRVAELESFTQAAETLNVPKATVSTAVQDLEALLGVRLLHRTTRRVRLTPEGVGFYERSLDLLADVEDVETMFRTESSNISGKIRIDMTVRMARDLVIPALPKFLELYPGIEIELSSTDRRVDLIREGIDCVVRVGNAVETGLMARDLGRYTMVNCASPAYIREKGQPKKIDDLKNHRLIFYAQQLGTKPDGFEYFDGEKYREAKMGGVITVNNTDSYEAACLAGLGIVQAPLTGMKRHLDSGALVEVLPKHRAEPMNLKLVYVHRRLLARRVRVFMDWVEPLVKSVVV